MFEYEDEYSLFHAKQGLILSIIFGGLLIFVFLLSFLLPETLRIIRFSLVVSIYLLYVAYFIFCIIGTINIGKGKKKVFPLIGIFIDRINV
jgi:uncharacterized Tic20 family protein